MSRQMTLHLPKQNELVSMCMKTVSYWFASFVTAMGRSLPKTQLSLCEWLS